MRPLRREIVALAREPISATDLARRLGHTRQRINYYLRQLARKGFLRRAGRRRRRNMFEQLYACSARGLALSPELLGDAAADWRRVPNTASDGYLLALSGEMQSDVARGSREAEKQGGEFSTFSFKSQFRFETSQERDAFARAAREAVAGVIARHASPYLLPDRGDAPGKPFRLVLCFYPFSPKEGPPVTFASRPGG